jgi:peptidoglycan hydrolase-like protein with peptidoglycan-binding domain
LLFVSTASAGFFDDIVNTVKDATSDTLEEVIDDAIRGQGDDQGDSRDERAQQQRQPTQPAQQPTRVTRQPAAPAPKPARPAYDRELVRQIQTRLNTLGFDAGAPDGLYGPGTRGAIEDFQRSAGIAVDGRPTQELLATLDARATETAVVTMETAPAASGDSEPVQEAPPPAAVSLEETGFALPECGALTQWAAGHDTDATVTLAPEVVLNAMFADVRTVPVFGAKVSSWSRNEFTAVRNQIGDCRRVATKQRDKAAADTLYGAYQVTIPTGQLLTQMERSRQQTDRAVKNLTGYHRSDTLVQVLDLAEQALRGADVAADVKALRVTHGVRQEVQALQNLRGYLPPDELEALVVRLRAGAGAVEEDMAAKNARFEALNAQLAAVPMTMEGAYELDRLLKDPVLAEVSSEESMAFQNAVMKKRRAISVAVRQQEAQQTAAAAAVPVDVAAQLERLIAGDSVGKASLRGIKPGIPYLYAKKFTSTRFGYKAGTGGDVFKEFAPTRRDFGEYKDAERRDGGHIQLETMGNTVGKVIFTEHYTGAVDLKAVGEWLTERFGKPDEFEFLGAAAVMAWNDAGMNLSVTPGNRTVFPFRSAKEFRGSVVVTLWSDDYTDYLIAAEQRCKELRSRPVRDLSVDEKTEILKGCKA